MSLIPQSGKDGGKNEDAPPSDVQVQVDPVKRLVTFKQRRNLRIHTDEVTLTMAGLKVIVAQLLMAEAQAEGGVQASVAAGAPGSGSVGGGGGGGESARGPKLA
jgi:hypothetical protein